MNDDERRANTKMSAVHSPASISGAEERRGTRALLLRACSLLSLALVVGLAALFLSRGWSQDMQQNTQLEAARSTMTQGTR